MGSTSDSKNETAKTAGSRQRARKLEGMGRAWGAWQRVQTDQNGNNAEGNVDGKQPGPWPTREVPDAIVGPIVKAVATTNALYPKPCPCKRPG
jgi:hypothetical protein